MANAEASKMSLEIRAKKKKLKLDEEANPGHEIHVENAGKQIMREEQAYRDPAIQRELEMHEETDGMDDHTPANISDVDTEADANEAEPDQESAFKLEKKRARINKMMGNV